MASCGDGWLGSEGHELGQRFFNEHEIVGEKTLDVAESPLYDVTRLAVGGSVLEGGNSSGELKRHDFRRFRFFQRFLKLWWRRESRSNPRFSRARGPSKGSVPGTGGGDLAKSSFPAPAPI